MPKFRKIPVEVEAIHLELGAALPAWFTKAIGDGRIKPMPAEVGSMDWGGGGAVVKTLEGDMRARVGDWIIKGVDGELYPCKHHIFVQTYEPA